MPLSLLVVACTAPAAICASTVTPGSTPPDESFTVPSMAPRVSCAEARETPTAKINAPTKIATFPIISPSVRASGAGTGHNYRGTWPRLGSNVQECLYHGPRRGHERMDG